MRHNVIKVALISQFSKINHTVENYLGQINNHNNTKYTINWVSDFETWIDQFHNSQYHIYLIDEYVLLPISEQIIIHIQHKNNFAPIIILTRSEADGQRLLDFGISDYLNLESLDSKSLEHSLKLTIARDCNRKTDPKNNYNKPSFGDFFQKINIGIALIAPSGQFLQANPKICQLLGYSSSYFSELTFQDITHPNDLESACKYIEQVLSYGTSTRSLKQRYLSKNREWKWVKITASLLKDINQNPLYLIAIIQESDCNNQNKIQSSETLYEDFFTYSTDGLFSLSVINNSTLIYDTINTAYEQIIGVSKATITGKNIKEILPTLEERKYRYCIKSKESLNYEHSRKIKGITHTWLTILVPIENEEGTVIKIHGSTRDITQQKNAIAQQIRQTRYRNLLRSIALKIRQSLDIGEILQTTVTELQKTIRADRVILFQFLPDKSGKVIKESVLPNFSSMIDEVINDQYCYDIICEKYFEGYVYHWSDINYTALSLCHQEMLQKYQICANLVLPIFRNSLDISEQNNSGQSHNYLWGLLGVQQCEQSREWTQDEIELLQHLIEQLNIALSQAELLGSEVKQRQELARSNSELERFAYVVSHDLQAPLQTISNYVQLLERRYREKLDEKADKYIKYIVGGVKRMGSQIQDLLQYSRVGREKSTFGETDCKIILQQAISNLQSEIDANNATIVVADNLPALIVDASQLTVLFQNLIGNSIKYRRQIPPHIEIKVQKQEKIWQFSLADNGIGLEAQYQKRIFQIFQRLHTQEEYPGTGIGLAICQKIVERHGGEIWVESQPGHGSVFYFTIPNQNYPDSVQLDWTILPNKIQ
ncbi:MAG: PAS domain S-box protein [Xenococcaceae cyanobacterium MO_167.B52]|nr:PAS domain S-box protein [Xenococcaceae cyanobacterium MO_167.B52]